MANDGDNGRVGLPQSLGFWFSGRGIVRNNRVEQSEESCQSVVCPGAVFW